LWHKPSIACFENAAILLGLEMRHHRIRYKRKYAANRFRISERNFLRAGDIYFVSGLNLRRHSPAWSGFPQTV